MKKIICTVFIFFTTIVASAQDNSQQEIAEITKALATKISQELNFDDGEALYLYKALFSTEQTRHSTEEQLGNNPSKLYAINQKIDKAFVRMLSAKFSESEIASIKQLIAQED